MNCAERDIHSSSSAPSLSEITTYKSIRPRLPLSFHEDDYRIEINYLQISHSSYTLLSCLLSYVYLSCHKSKTCKDEGREKKLRFIGVTLKFALLNLRVGIVRTSLHRKQGHQSHDLADTCMQRGGYIDEVSGRYGPTTLHLYIQENELINQ